MKSKITFIITLFCLGVVSMNAQTKITLQQAIDMGIKNNPVLKVSSAKIKVAETKLDQMKEEKLPHAGVSLGYSHFELLTPFALKLGDAPKPIFVMPAQGFDATIGSASVSQNLFSGFKVQSEIKSSQYLLQAVKADAEKDKTDLAYTISSAYYNIYKIYKSGEIIDENLKVLDEKIRELKSLEQNGVALHNDVLKVELQKTNLQLSKMEVENAKTTALYNFALMIGQPENSEYSLDTSSMFANNAETSIADLQNQALSSRNELRTNGLRIKATEENINALKSAYYPSIGLALNYYYIHPGKGIIPDKDAYINAGGVGLNISYNLSSFWEKARLDEAHANIQQLNSVNEVQTNMIKSEVFTNYNSWKLSTEKIKVSQASIDEATENYRTTDSRYKNSISTMTDLMDANTLLLQAKLNKVNAMTDAQLAYFKLINSTGK